MQKDGIEIILSSLSCGTYQVENSHMKCKAFYTKHICKFPTVYTKEYCQWPSE